MPKYWSVPPFWKGETVAVLATGPSLTGTISHVAEAHAAGRCKAIAVNDAYRLAPWADMLYAADCMWWKHHVAGVREFKGLKVTLCTLADVLVLQNGGTKGLDTRPTHIRTGSNSTYQAVHIAIHAGASRIVLYGLDLSAKRGKHFFGAHPKPLRNTQCYKGFIGRFGALSEELKRTNHPVQIVNATPESACRSFPFVDPASL